MDWFAGGAYGRDQHEHPTSLAVLSRPAKDRGRHRDPRTKLVAEQQSGHEQELRGSGDPQGVSDAEQHAPIVTNVPAAPLSGAEVRTCHQTVRSTQIGKKWTEVVCARGRR